MYQHVLQFCVQDSDIIVLRASIRSSCVTSTLRATMSELRLTFGTFCSTLQCIAISQAWLDVVSRYFSLYFQHRVSCDVGSPLCETM